MERHIGKGRRGPYIAAIENILTIHFGLPTVGAVFQMNDSYVGSDEEGKAWAVSQLAEIATKLRGADARTLVEGPDTVSTP